MDASTLVKENLNQIIVEAIAEVKGRSPDQIRTQIAEQNDTTISAKESMAVIAIIEERIGCTRLLTPVDLATPTTRPPGSLEHKSSGGNGCMDPAEDTSIGRLTQIIRSKIGKGNNL